MAKFNAIEKNGDGVLTFSADTYDGAVEYLRQTLIYYECWRLEENDE
jgi:hypothetical protein